LYFLIVHFAGNVQKVTSKQTTTLQKCLLWYIALQSMPFLAQKWCRYLKQCYYLLLLIATWLIIWSP